MGSDAPPHVDNHIDTDQHDEWAVRLLLGLPDPSPSPRPPSILSITENSDRDEVMNNPSPSSSSSSPSPSPAPSWHDNPADQDYEMESTPSSEEYTSTDWDEPLE